MPPSPVPVLFRRASAAYALPILALAASVSAADHPGLEDLIQAIDARRIEHDIPGAAVTLVSRTSVIWSGGLGVVDRESLQPVTLDTVFRIGSITKAFTGLGLLMLEESGRLRLDDPVTRHLPDPPYTNPWERTHPVSVAQLLEHTSGLQDLTRAEFDHSDPAALSLDQAFAVCAVCRSVRWQPGTHSVYSNTGYGIAGKVLETVAGVRYEDFVRTRLFDPLGMRSAGFFLDPPTRAHLATGYDTDARTPIRYWHMLYRPFGGINATARDMAPFVQLLLNDGVHGGERLLSAASIRRMETPRTSLAARNGLAFGYGLGIYQSYRDGVLFYTHGGDGDGYLSRFGYSRDAEMGYFVSINAFRGRALRAMQAEIERYIARRAASRPTAPQAHVDQSVLREYTGRYRLAAWRFPETSAADLANQAMTVTLENGVLHTWVDGAGRSALIAVSANLFRRSNEPDATSAFVRGEDGRLYFQEDENYVKEAPAPDAGSPDGGMPDSPSPASR
jgi:CubicO group peptidase (beta-lactamase class C family)